MLHPADITRPIQEEFRRFEKLFEESVCTDNPLLEEIWAYVLSKRGKQLRPQLVLLSAGACRGITDKSLLTAVALELLHTASLVHDDVVDASPMRRGGQSVQDRWTNKVAVLTGDYLLARSIACIEKLRNQALTSILSNIGASLSSGELLQLHARSSMWVSEKEYYRIIEDKTARLFAACTEAGAVSTGASARMVGAMRRFGLHLGMCFQLKDDVLDFGDSEELDKPTMGDVRDGKATLPLLVTLQRATHEESEALRTLCMRLHAGTAGDAFAAEQEILSYVLRYDGIRYAYNKMKEERDKALDALSILPDSDYKRSLAALAEYVIVRTK
ncbi:MAG: polyprenyl synthetase family protein [Paludibacteraceae bacterium]|nr:polyprenyl synthetase family protein [Paludibacteraceae bacterium]MBR1480769.1 polyprenyl synthetase family protein [Paludibacteraceae bacterium]